MKAPAFALAGLVALLAASAALHDLILVRILLALFLGLGSLVTALRLIEVLRAGEAIEFHSRTGGLGGGLGGWRLSQPAGLLILTAILAGAAVTVVATGPRPPDPKPAEAASAPPVAR